MTNTNIRLGLFLAQCGLTSRRKAKDYLLTHVCKVNGERVSNPASPVTFSDAVTVEGRKVTPEELEYWLLNKPLGVMSSVADPHANKLVTDFVKSDKRLYPVGRLDNDTTGLILLTNDGPLAQKLTHPKFEIPKAYELTIEGQVDHTFSQKLESGVELEDGPTAPARILRHTKLGKRTIIVLEIHEGRNRQVRRMCEALRIKLISLKRLSLGPLQLGNLPLGQARRLTPLELKALQRLPS